MKVFEIVMIGMVLASIAAPCQAKTETFGVELLDLQYVDQGWGSPQTNKSLAGNTISIGGQKFEHGFGTHAVSTLRIDLNGSAERFTAAVGVDDEVGQKGGSVNFRLIGDGKILWESGVMRSGNPAKMADVELHGVKRLVLNVGDGGDGSGWDHADWADAKIVMSAGRPKALGPPPESVVVLTPKPSSGPRINGAKIFGVRPGSPFLFAISASGNRPMTFAGDHLPDGLSLDPLTGRITGKFEKKGVHIVTLTAKNAFGTAKQSLKIVCGDTIALTPPLGWNSWNCFGRDVTDANVRAAAGPISILTIAGREGVMPTAIFCPVTNFRI
jgi:alpha-galactosidase